MDVISLFARHAGRSPEEAKFFWTGGPVEIARGVFFASMFSGVTAFETDEGLVLVDSGLARTGPMLASLIRSKTRAPVHTAIFTQGHVDHVFGLEDFLVPGQAAPRVIGHEAMPARFERYRVTAGHNVAINARQFGATVRASDESVHGEDYHTFGPPPLPPTQTFETRLDLEIGGLTFEVHHCRGETDDHAWIYCPERGVLCPGDLFIWAVPNAGNPQKVQRYPFDWAAGLREMASREPRSLCPGHGGPVVDDPGLIQTMLLETATLLEDIVEQTLEALNDGSPPHVDIVHRVALPVSDSPWLQNIYDDAEFIIRSVVRFYGGWWSGRPSELKPPPRDELAGELARLCGGQGAVLRRAEELMERGEPRLACSFADIALESKPDDPDVQRRVSAIYEQRAEGEEGLMARNLFRSAAAYARDGRPFR